MNCEEKGDIYLKFNATGKPWLDKQIACFTDKKERVFGVSCTILVIDDQRGEDSMELCLIGLVLIASKCQDSFC